MLTYPAAEFDQLLQDTWKLAESALAVATNKDAECTRLIAEKVELEKVAAANKAAATRAEKPFAFDASRIDDTLDLLQDLAILKPEGREKIAAALIADPHNILDLLTKVATSSQLAPEQGRGLAKSASARATANASKDVDGWLNVTPENP